MEFHAQGVDLSQRLEIDYRHDVADAALADDKALEFEALQNAADGASAHVKLLRERVLTQHGARRVVEQADLLSNLFVDGLD